MPPKTIVHFVVWLTTVHHQCSTDRHMSQKQWDTGSMHISWAGESNLIIYAIVEDAVYLFLHSNCK